MKDRRTLYGFLFIALVLFLIAGTGAMYKGIFRSTVPLTVESSRAGLTLAKGAPVKLRGVVIGKVSGITHADDADGGRVTIDLQIDSASFGDIPQSVTAEIVPPTAFGAKYVQLDPGTGAFLPIAAGDTIRADKVTVEVNTAFQNLTKVLNAAHPAQVNAALTAAAESVDQRGLEIGNLIQQTDRYLTSFNPFLRSLTDDINAGERVATTYAGVRPDLVALASNAGVTSQTLVQEQASLHAFELSLTAFDVTSGTLLHGSGRLLSTTFNLFGPVASVVARYSPELPCLVLGLASANKQVEQAVGGVHPGLSTFTRLVPPRNPYTYSQNLPLIGDTSGPSCYGLPNVTPAEALQPPPALYTGANPYAGPQPTAPQMTLNTLLGLVSGGANLVGGHK